MSVTAGATPYHWAMSRELKMLGLWLTGTEVHHGMLPLASGLAHVERELPEHEAGLERLEHAWAREEYEEGAIGRGWLRESRLHVAHMRSFIARWRYRLGGE